jgi:hypothetical protein
MTSRSAAGSPLPRPTRSPQTWIEGTFVSEFGQSPGGSLEPNGRPDRLDLRNTYKFDDEGSTTEEKVRGDNRRVLEQLRRRHCLASARDTLHPSAIVAHGAHRCAAHAPDCRRASLAPALRHEEDIE